MLIWEREKVDYLELQMKPAQLRLHIHGYGYDHDEEWGDWCKVSLELKAEDWLYFKEEEAELITALELDELVMRLEELVSNRMHEEWESFLTEDSLLRIKLYQMSALSEDETYIYMDWSLGWVYFTLYEEEILPLLDYLKKVQAGKTKVL